MIALLLVGVALATEPIAVDPPAAVGAPSMVTLTDDLGRPIGGVAIHAIARPGLDGATDTAIGVTDGLGRVRWTPDRGGLVDLVADKVTLHLAVPWPSPPAETIALTALLAAAALSAIAWGASSARSRLRS